MTSTVRLWRVGDYLEARLPDDRKLLKQVLRRFHGFPVSELARATEKLEQRGVTVELVGQRRCSLPSAGELDRRLGSPWWGLA